MKMPNGIGLQCWGLRRSEWLAHVAAEELVVNKPACDVVSVVGEWFLTFWGSLLPSNSEIKRSCIRIWPLLLQININTQTVVRVLRQDIKQCNTLCNRLLEWCEVLSKGVTTKNRTWRKQLFFYISGLIIRYNFSQLHKYSPLPLPNSVPPSGTISPSKKKRKGSTMG